MSGESKVIVRWSGEVQVTVRLGSNLKSILSLTLVDVKLVISLHSYDLIPPVHRWNENKEKCNDSASNGRRRISHLEVS